MASVKIVLLGSIPKGDKIREGWRDWKPEYIAALSMAVTNAEVIDGDAISDSAGPELVVGHDLGLIESADIVLVNAENKIGAGTAQEIVFAKYWRKPVVLVMPQNSHHRRLNITFHGTKMKEWVHPFLYVGADFIANDIEEATAWIKQLVDGEIKVKIKTLNFYLELVKKFKSK